MEPVSLREMRLPLAKRAGLGDHRNRDCNLGSSGDLSDDGGGLLSGAGEGEDLRAGHGGSLICRKQLR